MEGSSSPNSAGVPGTSIRVATEDDLAQLAEIERRVHLAPWNDSNFKGELEKPYSQILLITDDETDSVIHAYIAFWILFEECQILNVAVDFPYRGLGLAKLLVRKALGMAMKRGIKKAVLDVRKGNLPAIHLYQNLGFGIVQMRRNYYSDGEDAYQMTLSLEGEPLDF